MDLIGYSQAGDEKAFEALFHQYKNLVYKTAFLLLDHEKEAEDALQEVFVKVHHSLSSFDPSKGAFTTWLYRITVNHCLNWLRTEESLLALDEVASASLVEPSASLDTKLAEQAMVQQALSRLSGKLKAAVVLRYYGDLSYAQIAQVLDVPIGTVKSRLNQALKTLATELDRATEDNPMPVCSSPLPKRKGTTQ
jgi:RNA polymerase sigma-70 factor, ECF subfamily